MSPDFESQLQSKLPSRSVAATGAVPSLFQSAGASNTGVEWWQTLRETGGENDSGTNKLALKSRPSRAVNRSIRQ